MQAPPHPELAGLPLEIQPSRRSYATAVSLSAVFGFVGVQLFYLGRWAEGAVDVGLTVAWIYCFIAGSLLWGGLFLVLDLGHAFIVTIMLLTGNMKDGEGRIVCYPGQRLRARRG